LHRTLLVDRSATNADLRAMTNRAFFIFSTWSAWLTCVALLFGCPRRDD